MSLTKTDSERVRLAHEAARAYEDRDDLDPITNCDTCGRAFFTWETDDDTPLVWTDNGIVCETCAASIPGTWGDPTIEEFPNTAYQPWGDDIVSGWQATYETVAPGGQRILFVESAYVTTHDVDGETRYGTNESSEIIVLNLGGNEVFTEYTPGDPPTAGLVDEQTAHRVCERFVRADLRLIESFLSNVYTWVLDNLDD